MSTSTIAKDIATLTQAWAKYFPDFQTPETSQLSRWLAVHPLERIVYAFSVTAYNRQWHGASFRFDNAIRYVSSVANRSQRREREEVVHV